MTQYAVIFPGQGSQSVGMLADIREQFPEVKETFAEASEVLHYDLGRLILQGPGDKLDQTEYTQPALLAASYAIWRIIEAQNPLHPVLLAGHSLGEYTALVCAKALDFSMALKLVTARGQYMQEAVAEGEGAMAAIIGLEEHVLAEICEKVLADPRALPNEVLSPANFNSIGQVVIAGHKAAVERALVLSKEQGAKIAVLIPVSVPSHCQLMQPAARRLATLLEDVNLAHPEIPIINNVDVKPYTHAASIKEGLVKQLYKPVRWVETIQYFIKEGVTDIVECGPGKILTGLIKRIDKNLTLKTTFDSANLKIILERDKV